MKRNLRKVLFLMLCLFTLLSITACGKPSEEQVRKKMEQHLYEKYGEEFVVDRIGKRSANKQEFYEGRIYPKSIIGTEREDDSYYYGSASIDINSFGRLDKEAGDSYSFINRNDDVEKYLLPKVKELFGERIRLKVDVKHEVTGDGSWWAGYKSSSLQEMREDIEKEPDRTRIVLTLYLYIFDRIDNEEEKEERRKQIFEFIQYLKGEGLFEYLEMGVIFIDERVLAPSYKNYAFELENGEKVEKEVEGEIILLPTLELRKEMSELLQSEVDKMKEEELIRNMKRISKGSLEEYTFFSSQYGTVIYSWNMLEANYPSSLSKRDKTRNYSLLEHVRLGKGRNYIYK